MRRVKVFKREYNHRGTVEIVPDGEGLFHLWGVDFMEFESGPGNYTVAIVEREDGTIEKIDADLIQFIKEAK
jgi:hypothetical protein